MAGRRRSTVPEATNRGHLIRDLSSTWSRSSSALNIALGTPRVYETLVVSLSPGLSATFARTPDGPVDRRDQFLIHEGLAEILRRAGPLRALSGRLVVAGGDEDDGDGPAPECQLILQIEAADSPQMHVEHETVGAR